MLDLLERATIPMSTVPNPDAFDDRTTDINDLAEFWEHLVSPTGNLHRLPDDIASWIQTNSGQLIALEKLYQQALQPKSPCARRSHLGQYPLCE
jgi:hypothetical protein